MKQRIVWILLVLSCCGSVRAEKEISVEVRDRRSLGVTIYGDNMALVMDRRTVNLPYGSHVLAFPDVSTQIRSETALLRGPDLRVHEQRFEYDLLTPRSLLEAHVGQEVTLSRLHPQTGEERLVRAKVLSIVDGVVLQVDGRIETEVDGRLVYAALPDSFRNRPTLTMLVDSSTEGVREIELTYLTGGLTWQADYVAELNPADDRISLNAWATVTNESGTRFDQARLHLIAGDVRVARPPVAALRASTGTLALDMGPTPENMAEEAVFEHHLFTLSHPITLADKEKKQFSLFVADSIQCRKEYLIKGREDLLRVKTGETGRKIKAAVSIEVYNVEDAGLGRPLPGGVIRVYKKDGAGQVHFVGEDRMGHTPERGTIRLHLGEAFDVTADKVQSDFQKFKQTDTSGFIFESEYAVRLNNAKNEEVTITVQESIPGEWEIIRETVPHSKPSARLASWTVTVPPRETVPLVYRIRMKE